MGCLRNLDLDIMNILMKMEVILLIVLIMVSSNWLLIGFKSMHSEDNQMNMTVFGLIIASG